jgi:glutamine amidotransferase
MTKNVTVVDYGIGNLLSVARALEHCGATVTVSGDPIELLKAQRLILPGVGAFADGMAGLDQRGLVEPIKCFAATGRPLLGICLGMQLLITTSHEFGAHEGLGLISGEVTPIPHVSITGERCKVPHIGWNEIYSLNERGWDHSVLETSAQGCSVYLAHSFAVTPADRSHLIAEYSYGGNKICAAINHDNISGCQFHPEKSGETGLTMLHKFLTL